MSSRTLGVLVAILALTPSIEAIADPDAPATQSTNADAAGPATDDSGLVDIVVTARRTAENVQDVPVSVQVVSGTMIQDLAITQPSQLSSLTPGFNIQLTNPQTPFITMRGVRWTPASGTPAIPIYLNDISFDPANLLQTLYDVEQIEVLRGPQGTTRGAPSISGAVTIVTHRPDLEEFGGYVSALAGEHGHYETQGAINLPIMTDKLAVRLAANWEDSEGAEVRSLHDARDPSVNLWSGRISVRFQPIDSLTFDLMYQRLNLNSNIYTQVVGPGSAGIPAFGVPANFNGPPISLDDYRGVSDLGSVEPYRVNEVTFNAAWDFLGQRLSYNFGTQLQGNYAGGGDIDPANLLPGYDQRQFVGNTTNNYFVNEVRLSSIRAADNLFDYDVGYYNQKSTGVIQENLPVEFLPGAFGNPFTALPSPYVNPATVGRYILNADTTVDIDTRNYSVYGSGILHLPYALELSAGARWIHDTRPNTVSATTTTAYAAAFQNPAAGFLSCSALGVPGGAVDSPNYPGVCEVAIPPQTVPAQTLSKTNEHTIYNVSLSHKFTDDLLAYATVGSSWRAGLPAIGNTGIPDSVLFPKPEQATSYEVGVKTTWLDHRLRVNADLFQINYQGQLTQFQGIDYYSSVSGQLAATNQAFFANINARVRGVEGDIAVEPIRNLTLDTNLSYAQIESRGGELPCNDPTRPLTATNPIDFCASPSGETLNASPQFQASLNGGYLMPIAPLLDGYFRFVINHQGHNPNFGTSVEPTPAYTLVDLFAGITGNHSGWDVGIYAKNVFDKRVLLTSNPIVTGDGIDPYFGPPGYNQVTANLPREVGVSLRYAFGSH
jgi:iron complex outermembrane recepter protein